MIKSLRQNLGDHRFDLSLNNQLPSDSVKKEDGFQGIDRAFVETRWIRWSTGSVSTLGFTNVGEVSISITYC